jgi:hypothetical protein
MNAHENAKARRGSGAGSERRHEQRLPTFLVPRMRRLLRALSSFDDERAKHTVKIRSASPRFVSCAVMDA